MKNKIVAIILMGVMILSFTACGSQKPDLKEVEKAISNGEVTIEDALDKGWVSQKWVDKYLEENSQAAADKTVSFSIEEFETTTVQGEKYSNNNIKGTTFWAFIDLETDESKEWLDTLNKSYSKLKEKGADILVCVKNYTEDQAFENLPFPMILYNESVKNALDNMNMSETIEELPNCGNWFVNSYFASSWYSIITEDQLLTEVDIFTNLNQEVAPEGKEENAENAASAIG